MDDFGKKTAFGWRYISYWGFIRLNIDIPDNLTGEIALKKGEYTMAILAEDIDGNLKAKVLNPAHLFDSSFVMLSKPAAPGQGEGDFDHVKDVPVLSNYHSAKRDHDTLMELDKWQSGEYDDLMFMDDEVLH